MKGSIDSIETFGLVDGPGIRTVVFLNKCNLRCKYCHNPEMWLAKENNYEVVDLVKKILRSKPYFNNNGGVTFSGGEPLLQKDFLIEVCKELKKENIHIAIDTAGVGDGNYEEILSYVDLVLLDIKHVTKEGYKLITGRELNEVENFISACNKLNKKIWIRQVVVPGIMDNEEYLNLLMKYLKHIKNSERIDFLPFHQIGKEKYHKLNIPYPFEEKEEMDKEKCNELYEHFMILFNKNYY